MFIDLDKNLLADVLLVRPGRDQTENDMTDQAKPKGRGCFFYGCIVALVLFVLFAVVAGTATFFGYRALKNLALQYTDTTAMPLPKVELPQAELERLQARFNAFNADAKAGRPVAPLLLTGNEINALINHSPGMAQVKDRVHVAIEGDQVKGQISLPLDSFWILGLKGRYLNGAGVFKVSLENGVLNVRTESLEVKDKPLPEKFLAELRKYNLAEEVTKNADTAAAIQKLESIQVKDGAVTITARTPQQSP